MSYLEMQNYEQRKGYLKGLLHAIDIAKRYKCVDMANYIGELEEIIFSINYPDI